MVVRSKVGIKRGRGVEDEKQPLTLPKHWRINRYVPISILTDAYRTNGYRNDKSALVALSGCRHSALGYQQGRHTQQRGPEFVQPQH